MPPRFWKLAAAARLCCCRRPAGSRSAAARRPSPNGWRRCRAELLRGAAGKAAAPVGRRRRLPLARGGPRPPALLAGPPGRRADLPLRRAPGGGRRAVARARPAARQIAREAGRARLRRVREGAVRRPRIGRRARTASCWSPAITSRSSKARKTYSADYPVPLYGPPGISLVSVDLGAFDEKWRGQRVAGHDPERQAGALRRPPADPRAGPPARQGDRLGQGSDRRLFPRGAGQRHLAPAGRRRAAHRLRRRQRPPLPVDGQGDDRPGQARAQNTASMQTIRAYLEAHPERDGRALRHRIRRSSFSAMLGTARRSAAWASR